jgi:hypothetical protein
VPRHVDLVAEWVIWFAARGSRPLEARLVVAPTGTG